LKQTKEISTRYEIGRKLGSGSFGEVYACTSKISGEEYAIKIV